MPLALYLDFLYFVHMPPPATALTYLDLALHLWKVTVKAYMYEFKNCLHEIYVVIDKPDLEISGESSAGRWNLPWPYMYTYYRMSLAINGGLLYAC